MIGLNEYYWCFEKAVPENVCNDIIKYGNSKVLEQGLVGHEDSLIDNKEIRKSEVCFLDDQWIFDEIIPYIRTANENAGWNFDWSWTESIQFTKYKPDQFYTWHADDMPKPFGKNFNTLLPKVFIHEPNTPPKPGKIKLIAMCPSGPSLPNALVNLPKPFFKALPILRKPLPIFLPIFLNLPIIFPSLTSYLIMLTLHL